MSHPYLYQIGPSVYRRRQSRTVFVGDVAVGGNQPIRIQSMTTSDTRDTESIIREIELLVKAGCEIVRLTVPTKADCDNLKNIRHALKSKRLKVPLVADIHFTPSIALTAVDYVEKVRINPGNFVDKKLFKSFEYTDEEYSSELTRLEEKFTPLVLKCKDRGVAMRVGTNHGSLSDRIMNRYGDTPQGMVESAIEFLQIAAKHNYHDIILSMKASNTQIMITAYRLLAKRLEELGMDYPFHLGVTEAGEGEDGRIKSAIGIGTLLEEGIGDTIRVSLTEDSEHEIPVATMLASPYNQKIALENWNKELGISTPLAHHLQFLDCKKFSLNYQRRESQKQLVGHHYLGHSETVRVWTSYSAKKNEKQFLDEQSSVAKHEGVEFFSQDYKIDLANLFWKNNVSIGVISDSFEELNGIPLADKLTYVIQTSELNETLTKLLCKKAKALGSHLEYCFNTDKFPISSERFIHQLQEIAIQASDVNFTNFGFSLISPNVRQDYKILSHHLQKLGIKNIIHLRYQENTLPLQMDASIQIGALLIDGIGDSVQITEHHYNYQASLTLSYNILQGSRIRTSKTEYISCPSCGRTQFNLQKMTDRIRRKTVHLQGVKIAIMGCIVNGPGEMADADFGYVGTGVGKISLYVGKVCVERNIDEEFADQRLIELIKNHGRWIDAPTQESGSTHV